MAIVVRLALWVIALALLRQNVEHDVLLAVGYAAVAVSAAAVFVLWRHRRRVTRSRRASVGSERATTGPRQQVG